MASFDRKDAEVIAVFIKRRVGPDREVLRRASYDLITYPDGTSGLEPVPQPGTADSVPSDFEVDRIEVYDTDPFNDLNKF
jgi:hypothetical protein